MEDKVEGTGWWEVYRKKMGMLGVAVSSFCFGSICPETASVLNSNLRIEAHRESSIL